MWMFHTALVVCSFTLALKTAAVPEVAWMFYGLAVWQLFVVLTAAPKKKSPIILRLGGLAWHQDDFCRGWLITGQTGSGKTLGAINAMLWQVSKNCPRWGGLCVDDKGVYAETLRAMFRALGRENDLVVLEVRPPGASGEWQPRWTFNCLDDPSLPYSAKAKLICDVASSMGQRTEQSFFRTQAQVQMEFAFRALKAAGRPVALDSACDFLTSDTVRQDIMEKVTAIPRTSETIELADHYQSGFTGQPPEQLGGVKTTLANYLRVFTDRDLAQVFCPARGNIQMEEIERGKVLCVTLPQRFQAERRYLNTLLKLLFYTQALRRFDRTAEERAKSNLLICWADEAQRIVTAADDGLSDYNVVDVIREARATVVAATQAYTSLIPPLRDEPRAKVLVANLANRITFRAADEDSARLVADTLGKHKVMKRTFGYAGGKRTTSWTEEEKYRIEPHVLRGLKKFEAVVQHCEGGFRRARLPPIGPDGEKLRWLE
jgi:hypothetical protein